MKRFQFLLLDAGPIIKLFSLDIWDDFIEKCDVTIARTVAEDEVIFASKDYDKQYIDFGLKPWEEKGLIKIIEMESSQVKVFHEKSNLEGRYRIDPGEEESLTFLCNSTKDWKLCTTDGAAFSVLGFLGKGEQGISLEEILKEVGLYKKVEWKYTKKFREKWTQKGGADFIQGQSFG